MINSKGQESRPRGTIAFPMEYYNIDTSVPDYNLPYHWHTEFEFIHVLRGEYTIFAGTKEYDLKAGDFFLLSSNVIHGDSEEFRGECVYESLVFDPSMMRIANYLTEPFIEKLSEGELFFILRPKTDEPDFIQILMDLFHLVKIKPTGYEWETISTLFKVMEYITTKRLYERNEHFLKDDGKLIWLKCVMNLIKQKYNQTLTLDQMASSAGFSPKYFCRIFHEVTHYTPMEYLNQYRINRACEMLLDGNETVEDIAYCCGFNDMSYFIKLFKRYKNTTPLRYRNDASAKKRGYDMLHAIGM